MGDFNQENHLGHFGDTASSLVSKVSYEAYMEGRGTIGFATTENDPQGSMFVAPKEEIDRVLREANGDIIKVEKALGFPEGHFGDGPIVRVDIHNIHEQGLRVANGYESGANEFWNTRADSQGNLPNIVYVKDVEGNNTRYIDTTKTDPGELTKLNGQYWDEKGIYHKPNPDGYDGKTSTGVTEGVVNRISNNADNVSYSELNGFARGKSADVTSSPVSDGYYPSNYSNKDNLHKLGVADSNAPPHHTNNSDLSNKESVTNFKPVTRDDFAGKEKAVQESFQSVTKEDLIGQIREPKEQLQPVSMEDLKRNACLLWDKGSNDSTPINPKVNAINNSNTASAGMGM